VDLGRSFVPVHVTGTVRGVDPREVAVAVNGRIGAVAPVVRDPDGRAFSALLPESLLRQGANRLEVLAVQPGGAAGRLVALARVGGRASAYALDGDSIRTPGGRRFRIVEGGITGGVDATIREDEAVRLGGWAADARTFRPVEEVVGFAGDLLLFSGPPAGPRPDVAQLHRVPADDLAFHFDVPEGNLRGRPRVFALRDGVASPLEWFCGGEVRQDVGC
jgi:hypothetical protein